MNLLDRIWITVLSAVPLFISSCEEESAVGLDSEAFASEIVFEEISLSATNVFLDSARTSGAPRLLVGRNIDSLFGTTQSNAVVELTTNSNGLRSLVDREENGQVVATRFYEFQEAILSLEVNYVHSSNSSVNSVQTIEVRQLDDNILSSVYYLSDFQIPLKVPERDSIFTYDLSDYYKLSNEDSVNIDDALDAVNDEDDTTVYRINLPLSSELGIKLFNVARNGDINGDLQSDFKGLALLSGENDSLVVGFSPSGSVINMIYRIDERSVADGSVANVNIDTVQYFLNGPRFNQYDTDRSNALVSQFASSNGDEFTMDEDYVFANPSTGVYPKVSLAPLRSFIDRVTDNGSSFIQINRAEIELVTDNSVNDIGFSTGKYRENVDDIQFVFSSDNEILNPSGLLAIETLHEAAILTDGSYITIDISTRRVNAATLNEDSEQSTYNAVSTIFVQQWADELIEADQLTIMPSDVNNFKGSAFRVDEIKFKLYYAKTN